jgi:hypothetical protein
MSGLLVLFACAATGPVTEAWTDDGAWWVSLDGGTWGVGSVSLPMRIEDAAGEATDGLAVEMVAAMDDMDHGVASSTCVDEGAGAYGCDVRFLMPGLWTLDGSIGDGDASSSFRLVVAVE